MYFLSCQFCFTFGVRVIFHFRRCNLALVFNPLEWVWSFSGRGSSISLRFEPDELLPINCSKSWALMSTKGTQFS